MLKTNKKLCPALSVQQSRHSLFMSFLDTARKSSFLRATAWLTGGTAAAQVITVAALPILTRLYSPEDFEILAVYLALLGIFSSIACLRLNIAIPIPEKDEHGADLLVASVACALIFAMLLMIPALVWPDQIAALIGVPGFASYVWLLPLGVALAGLYSALQYWSSRMNRFPLVARSRLVQAGVGVGTQVGAGALAMAPFGLLFGHMLHQGAGSLRLALTAWRSDRVLLPGVTRKTMTARVCEYRRFPTYSTIEALSNTAGVQLPLLLIASFALGPEAGFVLLAMKVLGVPMQLVGRAISQVYLARAPEKLRAGELYSFTLGIMKPLAALGLPLLAALALVAPWLFSVLFGPEWQRAGVLVQWMTPWFMLQLLSSPLSMILHVTGRQRSAMVLQLVGLLLRSGLVLMVGLEAAEWIGEAYAISGVLFYALYLLVIWNTLHSQKRPLAA